MSDLSVFLYHWLFCLFQCDLLVSLCTCLSVLFFVSVATGWFPCVLLCDSFFPVFMCNCLMTLSSCAAGWFVCVCMCRVGLLRTSVTGLFVSVFM